METATAVSFMSCCSTSSGCCAAAALFFGMAVMSGQQGDEHNGAAGMSSLTSAQSSTGGSSGSNIKDDLKQFEEYKNLDENMKKLAEGGYTYDPKTGTIKAGDKTYKASDFANSGAMSAAGFPKSSIDQAMAGANAMSKRAEKNWAKVKKTIGAATAANGFDEGGGGGAGGGAAAFSDEMGAGAGYGYGGAGGATGAGIGREPTAVAGMQKNFNGEPIGVAGDSIFEMMKRRFKVKDKQNAFFNETDLLIP